MKLKNIIEHQKVSKKVKKLDWRDGLKNRIFLIGEVVNYS